MNPIKAQDENKIKIRPYDESAYGEIRELNSEVVYFKPKNIKEVNSLRKVLSEIENARLVNVAGVAILVMVSFAACATFLGLTKSTAPAAYEDSMRLLLLIVGGVLGALFGASASASDKGKE